MYFIFCITTGFWSEQLVPAAQNRRSWRFHFPKCFPKPLTPLWHPTFYKYVSYMYLFYFHSAIEQRKTIFGSAYSYIHCLVRRLVTGRSLTVVDSTKPLVFSGKCSPETCSDTAVVFFPKCLSSFLFKILSIRTYF